jgi:hypothetical protein
VNWRKSIERLDNQDGYTVANTVAIVGEFQSGTVQWTREAWSYFCAVKRGWESMTDEEKASEQVVVEACVEKARVDKCHPLRKRLKKLIYSARSSAKKRGHICTVELEDLFQLYLKYGGRCAYMSHPLFTTGYFRMSLERRNVNEGYIPSNVLLVLLLLNVPDRSRLKKHDHDEDTGSSGWNVEKVQYAMQFNDAAPRKSYVQGAFEKTKERIEPSQDQLREIAVSVDAFRGKPYELTVTHGMLARMEDVYKMCIATTHAHIHLVMVKGVCMACRTAGFEKIFRALVVSGPFCTRCLYAVHAPLPSLFVSNPVVDSPDDSITK